MHTSRTEIDLTPKQTEAVKHLAKTTRGIVWWKIGEGKSRIALAWSLEMTKGQSCPLIICSPQAFRQWQDEILAVGLEDDLKPVFFSAGLLSHRNAFDALNWLLSAGTGINCLVIDELWMFKNPKAKRTRVIHQVSRQFPSLGLSGSMITARNIEDLYGQAFAMGLDGKIANNLTDFRKRFCIEVQNYAGFIERYPKKTAVAEIQKKLKDNVHIYFPKENKEIRDITVNIDPTKEQLAIKDELVKEFYIEYEKTFTLEVKTAASLLTKLQEVSDGFLYDAKGDHLSIPSNKLHRLVHYCSECVNAGERVLVWFAYRQSIEEALKISDYKTVILRSGEQFDVRTWKQPEPVVCYATIGSGSSLNDFANVRYAVIYSANYSNRSLQQARGRTNRRSTLHSCCYYYYYQTIGFPDAKVYDTLTASQNTEQAVINISKRIIDEWLAKQPQAQPASK